MDVSEIGEFGLIKRLRASLFKDAGNPAVGIGDDAAAFESPKGLLVLATCDAQVEGVHFSRHTTTPRQIGRRAAAINISDIAAMGGKPTFMLISLGLPKNTPVLFVDELYKGLGQECDLHGIRVIGGNMAKSPERIFIDIFLLGQVQKDKALLRSGAQDGDLVGVTGNLGDSSAGLALLEDKKIRVDVSVRDHVVNAHICPKPRVAQGLVLGSSGFVTSAIDVSDGAVSDIKHICEESGLGAMIWSDKLPVSDAAKKVAKAFSKDVLEFALFGGEDYELAFTAPEKHMDKILAGLEKIGVSATIIGRMNKDKPHVRVLAKDGSSIDFSKSGWDHFLQK